MESEEATKAQRAWRAVRRWFNLGFPENQLGTYNQTTPFSVVLASDNIAFMPAVCAFSCFLAVAITIAEFILVEVSLRVALPTFIALIAFAVLAILSAREFAPEKRPRAALFLCMFLAITWYAFTMYCDIALQPFQQSVLTCLAFVTLPLLFDARPRDNLFGALVALVAFLLLEHAFVGISTRVMDVLGVYVAIIIGLMLSQRKTASKLNEIIYLDMYRTATKTSILVAQVDLRTDAFHALQVPDYMMPVVSKQTIASNALVRIGETFIAPDYQREYAEFFRFDTLRQRLAKTGQLNFTFEDFRNRWCLVTVIVQSKQNNVVNTAVIIVRDIDEEKRQELEYQKQLHDVAVEAQRANASKTNFLRRMSHDIRTPINGIRGMVDIGDHFPDDAQKQAECREKIRSASGFLLSLVNNVLDMSKLESGAVELEHKPFDLMELSRSTSSILMSQAAEHGVRLLTSDDDGNVEHSRLIGSPLHLQQILLNLGGNAAKYNRPGGTITIGCREISATDEMATFEITCADTGIGMSREFQEHAFEPFAQEEKVGSSTYTGSGLGLAIVKELVERMGGTISLESEEGVGSTFTVVLPFEIDRETSPACDQAAQAIDLHGKHALLVEDDDLNAEIAEFVLGNEGLTVQRAANGAEAVEAFSSAAPGTFDMIFMDVMMPVMNGLEATRAIRDLDRPDAQDIPIFAMTANAFQDDVRESLAAGMTAHLTKPLEIDKIRETLARVLA